MGEVPVESLEDLKFKWSSEKEIRYKGSNKPDIW